MRLQISVDRWALISTLTSIKAPSHWFESSRVTSSSKARAGAGVTYACEPHHCLLPCRPGTLSNIWPKARLLTNEPVEDVRHHFETVKGLSATSKIMHLMLNKIDEPGAVKLKNSDMISGFRLIWHRHLDVRVTALYTWHTACQLLSWSQCHLFWHHNSSESEFSEGNVTFRDKQMTAKLDLFFFKPHDQSPLPPP